MLKWDGAVGGAETGRLPRAPFRSPGGDGRVPLFRARGWLPNPAAVNGRGPLAGFVRPPTGPALLVTEGFCDWPSWDRSTAEAAIVTRSISGTPAPAMAGASGSEAHEDERCPSEAARSAQPKVHRARGFSAAIAFQRPLPPRRQSTFPL